jgi:hypothetical protein
MPKKLMGVPRMKSLMKKKMGKWAIGFNTALAGLLVLPLVLVATAPSAEAKSKQFRSSTSTSQSRRSARNTGINRTLSPNLSCAQDERNNNVTKGALYGAGSGLLIGGPIGAVAGAGAGAIINQEQNRDACR